MVRPGAIDSRVWGWVRVPCATVSAARLLRRQFVVAFGALGSSVVLGGCSEAAPPVRIGSNLWPGYEPLYVLRDRGMLPPEVRLVELVSASQVMRGIRNGLLDGGGLTLDEALRLAADTGDVEIVAVMDLSAGADAVVGRGDVRSLGQLAGKVVGVEKSAVGAYLLARTLERAGLPVEAIRAEYIPVQEHRTAFEQGRVDALVTFEPVLGEVRALGANVLLTSADLPGEIVDVLAVRRSLVTSHPAQVEGLREAWFRARDLVAASLATDAPLATPRLGRDPGRIRDAYAGLVLPDRAQSNTLLGEGDQSLRRTAARLVEAMVRIGVLERPIDPAVVFPRGRVA